MLAGRWVSGEILTPRELLASTRTLKPWTASLNKGTMGVMRVDNVDPGNHDHGFGLGAHQPEPHEVGLTEAQLHDAGSVHGLFDSLGHGATENLGGHVEVGHLGHDVSSNGLHNGLEGLHDSVHSIGLGFGGDEHHSLHDGLHESSLHDGLHESQDLGHDLTHGVSHDPGHDPGHDVQHHDTGLGDLFHH